MSHEIEINPEYDELYTKKVTDIVNKHNLFAKFPDDMQTIRDALKDAFMEGACCGGMDCEVFDDALSHCSEE